LFTLFFCLRGGGSGGQTEFVMTALRDSVFRADPVFACSSAGRYAHASADGSNPGEGAKKTKKRHFRPKKREKTLFFNVFDLIKCHFDDILGKSNGGLGILCAENAVCRIPDFPGAASLPARYFRLMLKRKKLRSRLRITGGKNPADARFAVRGCRSLLGGPVAVAETINIGRDAEVPLSKPRRRCEMARRAASREVRRNLDGTERLR